MLNQERKNPTEPTEAKPYGGSDLDRFDWAILRALAANGKMSASAVSEEIGLSKTPCWTRIQRLEKCGIIKGYHANIDRNIFGFNIIAFCEVSVDFKLYEDFERAILKEDYIIECHSTAGQGDYMLKVVSRDTSQLDTVLRRKINSIPGVLRFSTVIGLNEIKSDQYFSQFPII